MSSALVEARALGKMYGLTRILVAVDLAIAPGQGLMVMGENGTGKSTLLKALAGLTAPSNGQALLFGEPSRRLAPERRRRVGLLAHQSFLYSNLSAAENLDFYAALYGLPGRRALVGHWLDRVGLGTVAHRRAGGLSRGMERRLAIARALIAEPEVLLFDEPFAGLDAQGIALVGALLREALERGCAVVMTTHVPLDITGARFAIGELAGGRLAALAEPAVRGRLLSLFGR